MRRSMRQYTTVRTVKTACLYVEQFMLGEFFLNGWSVDQNFHFFTKVTTVSSVINCERRLSPRLSGHVPRLKRCKPFPYRSIRTDAMGR